MPEAPPGQIGLSNKDIKEISGWDQDHHLHPWAAMDGSGPGAFQQVSHADGIHIWDADGRRYIDGPGGMWCVQVGYGRREIVDAMADQALRMPYASPWSSTTEPAARLAQKLATLAPGDLNTVHFTTGGSTAVDTAIRAVHFLNNQLGRPDKKIVIARERGYHGSTYLAASVTGKDRFESRFDTASDLVRFLPDVNPYQRPSGMTVEAWCDAKVADLEALIAKVGADKIGAFIAEPILCSGGVIVPPPGYHQRTAEICRRNDIVLISDEVVTGFGRLGHWFASEEVFGITPDIITCAKGLTSGYLPLGACIFSDALIERMNGADPNVYFVNGYTYAAHPVASAAALANLQIFETDGLLDHVRAVSPHFQARLADLGARFDIVGDARGMGLLGCLEGRSGTGGNAFERDSQFGARLDAYCEEMGLILRPILNMAVFSPPLTITLPQIDEMFDIMDRGLTRLTQDYRG